MNTYELYQPALVGGIRTLKHRITASFASDVKAVATFQLYHGIEDSIVVKHVWLADGTRSFVVIAGVISDYNRQCNPAIQHLI